MFLIAGSSPAEADWSFRKKITIDRADVGAAGTSNTTITDFPFLINVTDTDLRTTANGGDVTDADGDDISFWAFDDATCGGADTAPCALHHEIEEYVASTGELVVWVKIPSLNTNAATSDTEIYMYYGNSSVTSPLENPVGVWDSDFKGVWHLHDDFEDSTSNNNDGTNSGSTNAAGTVADGQDFDGTDDLVTTGSTELETANNFTISLWFNADATDFAHHLVWQGESGGNGWGDIPPLQEMNLSLGDFPASNAAGVSSDNLLSFLLGDTDETHDTDVLALNTSFTDTTGFHHVLITVSDLSTSPSAEMFLDGVSVDTDTGTTTRTSRTDWDTALRFGRSDAVQRHFDGVLDEIRISTVVRSDDWAATECKNADDPAGSITVGSAEADPALAVHGFNGTALAASRGVMLHWDTRREVSNLGFHVYRERGGALARLNASLVVGSALSAGGSNLSNGGHAYSFWDSNGSRADQYWIDDLDLLRGPTRHGPFTPLAGVTLPLGQAQPPSSSQLADLDRRPRPPKQPIISRPRPTTSSSHAASAFPGTLSSPHWEAPGLSPSARQRALAAAAAAVKLSVTGSLAWRRVDYPSLVSAGIDPGLDPRNLQLYHEGREVSISVTGENDGSLDAGDFVEFLGRGSDEPWSEARVYWLVQGTRRGQRISVGPSVISNGFGSSAPRSFPDQTSRSDELTYFPSLLNGEDDNFFGAVVSDSVTLQELEVLTLDASPGGTAQLDVSLQGITSGEHRVRVTLNGTELGLVQFADREEALHVFPVAASLLVTGTNVVALHAVGGGADFSFVDALRLCYPRKYQARDDQLLCRVRRAGQVTIDGFGSPRIRVLDITDEESPEELRPVVERRANDRYSCTVATPRSGQRELLTFTDAAIHAVDSVTANRPSSWHEAQRGQIVILTHRDFSAAARDLREHRRRQGFSVAVVDAEDVYDEFNFGSKDPRAIRDFLEAASTNWSEAPSYVVLLGDASLDPRGYLGSTQRDFVPTQIVETELLETASDGWFVDFNGDAIPEIAIGRLPARDPSEASHMVRKAVHLHRRAPLAAPLTSGSTVILIADEPDEVFDFENTIDRLRTLIPRPFTVETIAREQNPLAHRQLWKSLSEGPLWVTYVGHGGRRTWGVDLLDAADVPALPNRDSLAFFTTLTCLNGYFHDAFEDCLAEELMRAEGGAVAVWSSSAMTRELGQLEATTRILRELFDGSGVTIGQAIRRAKAAVADLDVRRSLNLLGDPATQLGL